VFLGITMKWIIKNYFVSSSINVFMYIFKQKSVELNDFVRVKHDGNFKWNTAYLLFVFAEF